MVVAVGIDIVSVERFRKLLRRYKDRAIKRLFPEGVNYCKGKRRGEFYGCLAARFALKEATIKALSQVGISLTLSQVKTEGGGRELRLKVEGVEGYKLLFSISHEKEFAVAVVNVVKEEFQGANGKPTERL